jgi:aspartyl/asparaginyl-tRNA synthetase
MKKDVTKGSMSAVKITDLPSHIDREVSIKGFVQSVRAQGKVGFISLRNITGIVQCVFLGEALIGELKKVSTESYIQIDGKLVAAKQAPGGVEIQVVKMEIITAAAPELPIPVVSIKGGEETEAPVRFDYRWIDLRKPEKAKIFKVWTSFEKGLRKYWNENDYIQLYSPSFMSTPSETGAQVFEVNYFDRKAYLAQSPQFYKQMAMASGLGKVFIAGPVFRAEESFTTRHLTEFTGFDFEISDINDHHDLMDAEEGMLVAAFTQLHEDSAKQFPDLKIEIPSRPFPRISMVEAKKILADENKKGATQAASSEDHDLSPEEERAISEYVKKEHNHDFVFITDYHKSKSAFYHMRHPDDSDRSRRADLIYRGIEVTTLAQREHRIDILEKQAKEKGMDLAALHDYLNFFRYGVPTHGGAGIGPGRLIMKILDLPNVREATYLPRDVKRLNP